MEALFLEDPRTSCRSSLFGSPFFFSSPPLIKSLYLGRSGTMIKGEQMGPFCRRFLRGCSGVSSRPGGEFCFPLDSEPFPQGEPLIYERTHRDYSFRLFLAGLDRLFDVPADLPGSGFLRTSPFWAFKHFLG